MNISFTEFKKMSSQFQAISKHAYGGELSLRSHYDLKYNVRFNASYAGLKFKSLAKLYAASKIRPIAISGLVCGGISPEVFAEIKAMHPDTSRATIQDINQNFAKDYSSLKIFPGSVEMRYRAQIIRHAPIEVTEGAYTYRILTRVGFEVPYHEIALICRNDEPMYDVLDRGFYISKYSPSVDDVDLKGVSDKKAMWLVTNEYNVNTAHVFAMFAVQPQLNQLCRNECFIHSRDAELIRLKMQKKLTPAAKQKYEPQSRAIEDDYKKNTTLIVVGKLMSGDVERTTINNIVLTKTKASYERISIEADDLLDVLYKELNFNGEFDIYNIAEIYGKHIQSKLELEKTEKTKNAPAEEPEEGVALDEQAVVPEAEEDVSPKKELPTFKVNNIPITAAISSTRQRYINNIRINKEEIDKVIHRASCHSTEGEYKLFLKSISRMSIKWHDIIANGLQVKIHDNMNREDFADPVPKPDAPALKFIIDKDDKQVKIKVDENRYVRVALGRLIKRVATLNKRTDNRTFYPKSETGYYMPTRRRNAAWCMEELVTALVDCSTFTYKEKNAEGETLNTETRVLLTRNDIIKLLDVANAVKKAAIERSKQFLETAVKMTGAEEITFLDTPAYKVTGGLRTYAVVIKNAKVYDFETKQYRCIVNDEHYAGAGYDDIAARLLALKNDSVMQDKIGTLKGSAQPGAENVHNDYIPDRDNVSLIDAAVDKALAKP